MDPVMLMSIVNMKLQWRFRPGLSGPSVVNFYRLDENLALIAKLEDLLVLNTCQKQNSLDIDAWSSFNFMNQGQLDVGLFMEMYTFQ